MAKSSKLAISFSANATRVAGGNFRAFEGVLCKWTAGELLPRANDPYSAPKTTLKAEINAEVWATLNNNVMAIRETKVGAHYREGDQPLGGCSACEGPFIANYVALLQGSSRQSLRLG